MVSERVPVRRRSPAGAMSATAHIVWDQTYENAKVPPGVAVENTGTVLGTIHVSRGGQLVHRGFASRIEAETGGRVVMQGMTGQITAERVSDVVFVVDGNEIPMSPGYGQDIPFTGPEGWGQLNEPWAHCVRGIEQVIEGAHLEQAAHAQLGADPATIQAYMLSFSVTAVTDMSDLRMWALLSATVLNRVEDLAVLPAQAFAWSPNECRELLDRGRFASFAHRAILAAADGGEHASAGRRPLRAGGP